MSETITATKPKACKYCEHWDEVEEGRKGICDLAYASKPVDTNSNGFELVAPWCETLPSLETGPDFYCCHFKEKS